MVTRARKKRSAPTSGRKPNRTTRTGAEQRVAVAAANLAARQGWHRTTLAEVAAEAGMDLGALYDVAPTKAAVVSLFVAGIDRQMLQGASAGAEGDSSRDRLFGVVMARLDLLRPHKEALRAFTRAAVLDFPTLACVLAAQRRSVTWMLEAAGVPTSGIEGAVNVRGLGLILLSVGAVWMGDDSEDMAATMAHLDRRLCRAEQVASLIPWPSRRQGDAAA